MSNPNLKATNPKDALGVGRLPLDLIPDTGLAYAALAFLEGALKYGKFNWRVAGVRWSVYEAALKRHLQKLKEGEWADPKTRVPHLGSMVACLLIIADAQAQGKFIDDRPPSFEDASEFIDLFTEDVAHLKKLFKDYNPKQYTIEDTRYEQGARESTDSGSPQVPLERSVPREDAQSLPGRDTGRLVFQFQGGPVGGVEVVKFDTFTEKAGETKYHPIQITENGEFIGLCNYVNCAASQCIANRVAQGQI